MIGVISAVLANKLPGAGTIYLGQQMRFKAPVRPGDTVHACVTVVSVDPARARAVLSTVCRVRDAIVIEGDGPDLSVRIVTDEPVVDTGVVDAMVTATGEDVSGHTFFAFGNGTTVYAPRELDLLIVNSDV